MELQQLLRHVKTISTVGSLSREISGIASDHRAVAQKHIFICYEGVNVDGHTFIPQAIEQGATTIVGEHPHPVDLPTDITYIQVPNGRIALSYIAANWHSNPADRLKLIGITGTNGKTSTAYFAHSILEAAGLKAAIMGTVDYRYGDVLVPASAGTTPDPITLHRLFKQIVDAGLDYVIMETSSQGLAQHRLAGLTFDTAVFTNLTQDHLDYHQTMEEYLNAKLMLFQQIRPEHGLAILNADDPAFNQIRQQMKAPILTYGVENRADITVREPESTLKGLAFTAMLKEGSICAKLRLLGHYNLYNALAAIGISRHHGCSPEAIQSGLASTIVPGRFQLIDRGQDFAVVVDYAHTPDGLENLLTAARKIAKNRLISVFGCGGDRDRSKRPKMGNISATIADHSVVTSDNPRTEDANRIIDDILEGLPEGANYQCITDRRRAIGHAIQMAAPGDLVAIAGKGHETYQEINGEKFDFDDCKVAAEFLDAL